MKKLLIPVLLLVIILSGCTTEYEISNQKEEDIIEGKITLAKPIQQTGEIAEPAAIVHFNPQVTEKS